MFCSKCGKENLNDARFCVQCGAPLFQASALKQPVPTAELIQTPVQYAGFWLRFVASLIDGLILLIPYIILAALGDPGFVTIILGWLYFALTESSERQATIGKSAIGIKVTDLNGSRIDFGKATARYFSKIISALIIYIGFIMAGFTQKKQALHDIIAGTLVVKK